MSVTGTGWWRSRHLLVSEGDLLSGLLIAEVFTRTKIWTSSSSEKPTMAYISAHDHGWWGLEVGSSSHVVEFFIDGQYWVLWCSLRESWGRPPPLCKHHHAAVDERAREDDIHIRQLLRASGSKICQDVPYCVHASEKTSFFCAKSRRHPNGLRVMSSGTLTWLGKISFLRARAKFFPNPSDRKCWPGNWRRECRPKLARSWTEITTWVQVVLTQNSH